MTVYLLHLMQPVSRGVSPSGIQLVAAHYLGWTDDLISRIGEHADTTWEPLPEPIVVEGKKRRGEKKGPGATFMGYVNYMHIDWSLARTWDGADLRFEKKLKNRKCARKLCPICNPGALKLAKEIQS